VKRASEWFSADDQGLVAKAVGEAERATSGEIVPVVATRSGRYERAEVTAGLAAALSSVAAAWLLLQRVVPAAEDWSSGYEPSLGLVTVLALFAGGFALGAFAVRLCPPLRRLLTGRRAMREEVTRAAAEAFERFHVKGTKGATGIIVYLSLYEHMVVVLGDEPIAEKIDEAAWGGIVACVIGGIKAGKPAQGLCEGIAACGELLAKHFPIAAGDVNELGNELRVVD